MGVIVFPCIFVISEYPFRVRLDLVGPYRGNPMYLSTPTTITD